MLGFAFVASGFSALLYQVVWQRVLYTLVGITVEAVTLVVTAFLLGLGLGSLVGGALSRGPDRRLPLLFALAELGVAAFGMASLPMFRGMVGVGAAFPALTVGLGAGLLLFVPTLLMGSTLPLLVAYAVRRSGNVGSSVGALYALNTLGSALAALVAVGLLLRSLGQEGTIWVAAGLNAAAALLVAGRYGGRGSRS